jgi:hypothetical protein
VWLNFAPYNRPQIDTQIATQIEGETEATAVKPTAATKSTPTLQFSFTSYLSYSYSLLTNLLGFFGSSLPQSRFSGFCGESNPWRLDAHPIFSPNEEEIVFNCRGSDGE